MDVLSDVIAVMRTGEPRSARVEWRAPWGQRFGGVPGAAGFQVVLRGSCWLIPADADPVPLTAGDVVFLPHAGEHALADAPSTPLAEYACHPRDDSRFERRYAAASVGRLDGAAPTTVTLCGAYQLDTGRGHPLLDDLPPVLHLPARSGHHPRLRAAVDLLGAELEEPQPGIDAIVPALLDTLLLYILRAWLAEQPGGREGAGWAAAFRDPAISAALEAIHRDPAHPWTVAGLGTHAGLSRAAFSRRFTSLVGRPPPWWRLTTAMRLLRDSDAPLSVVAGQIGYGSEFAFANAFKREFGVAPGRYRRDARSPTPPRRLGNRHRDPTLMPEKESPGVGRVQGWGSEIEFVALNPGTW
ncbi:AraC family transcriptional regulator [Actinomadura sp. KC345]|uniref:AraC family transcriptional regulator n=1 Tax=Actinomadura sp. KC345 TaxID=2530371 RepID=UPI001043A4BB|nr:AraC family transcriptional regulator [Actinomadura sp. KC345]TDC56837.1 AraC family transcriptional regulator [Actinomadura sp. KC345]